MIYRTQCGLEMELDRTTRTHEVIVETDKPFLGTNETITASATCANCKHKRMGKIQQVDLETRKLYTIKAKLCKLQRVEDTNADKTDKEASREVK